MKNKKRIIILGTTCLALVGSVIGTIANNRNTHYISENIQVESGNISFTLLKDIQNRDGTFKKTLQYTFNPPSITDRTVKIEIYFAEDKSDCSNVLTATVDKYTQTIELVCLKEFDKTINLKITSTMNREITATLIIDYVKKIDSITLSDYENWGIGGNSDMESFKIDEFFSVDYSVYSKEKNYTFAVRDAFLLYNGNISYENGFLNDYLEDTDTGLGKIILDSLHELGELPSSEDLWNAYDNEIWRSYIYEATNDSYFNESGRMGIPFLLTMTLYCVENENWYTTYEDFPMHFCVGDFDYSDYIIYPESIEFSEMNVEF